MTGHVAVIDAEALGDDEASGLVEEMKARQMVHRGPPMVGSS